MKKFPLILTLALSLAARLAHAAAADVDSLKKSVTEAIDVFKKADTSVEPFFKSAAGYAVFPEVGKGGLVFGGARGHGLVYEQGKLLGKVTLTQATFGAQIGGQVFRELVFFETAAALEALKKSSMEMSAQVGAVAAAEGAAQNARYREGVLVFTRPVKGLMAEASVGGQKFKFEPLKE
jgi:lipid-binding SYLF domain-containing protein